MVIKIRYILVIVAIVAAIYSVDIMNWIVNYDSVARQRGETYKDHADHELGEKYFVVATTMSAFYRR